MSHKGKAIARACIRNFTALGHARATLPGLLLWSVAVCNFALASAALAGASAAEIDRVRSVVLHSRQMGAHGLGYGERSLNELSQKLTPTDIPILTVLIDDKNCSAAIGPVHAMTKGVAPKLKRYSEARDVLTQMAGYVHCPAPERKRAREIAAMLEQAERDCRERRMQDFKRRDAQDARLQAEGMKLLDPSQRASVSREECFAVAERNRAAIGIKPGIYAASGALFERA